MAANSARRTLQFSSTSAKTLLTRSTTTTTKTSSPFASKAADLIGLAPSRPIFAPRLSLHRINFSRLPVELGGALSLMPLHSVTASALFTSLLSLHNHSWGYLSEGATLPFGSDSPNMMGNFLLKGTINLFGSRLKILVHKGFATPL